MTMIEAAQAQTPGAMPDVSPWQVFAADPTFAIFSLVPLAIIVIVLLVVRRRYARFFGIQREALDHRKTADAEVLAHNRSVEDMIARQYATVNTHNEQALARSEEVARLSAQMLAQMTAANQNLSRIAERLERIAGPAA